MATPSDGLVSCTKAADDKGKEKFRRNKRKKPAETKDASHLDDKKKENEGKSPACSFVCVWWLRG
jgi:hypothetical protein